MNTSGITGSYDCSTSVISSGIDELFSMPRPEKKNELKLNLAAIKKLKYHNLEVNLDSPWYGYDCGGQLHIYQSADSFKEAVLKEIDAWIQ